MVVLVGVSRSNPPLSPTPAASQLSVARVAPLGQSLWCNQCPGHPNNHPRRRARQEYLATTGSGRGEQCLAIAPAGEQSVSQSGKGNFVGERLRSWSRTSMTAALAFMAAGDHYLFEWDGCSRPWGRKFGNIRFCRSGRWRRCGSRMFASVYFRSRLLVQGRQQSALGRACGQWTRPLLCPSFCLI